MKEMTKVLLLVLIMAVGLSGCGSSSKKRTGKIRTYDEADLAARADEVFELNSDSDSRKAGGLRTVYFDFNSSRLRSDTKDLLRSNADILKANDNVEIQIEGHCDERGGVQYNLALGQRRAKSVRDYLIALGIRSSRLDTISFGKERPVAYGHDEDAWSQNRRGNFVVTSQ
ncbi:MAG: peptidoglycan-associated lipoprotein Pal [Bacteriovoracaceae bacterium]|nr:peptidoglycan-associated lipoprotein Pal [Bacteriovoracaceae bacterium]